MQTQQEVRVGFKLETDSIQFYVHFTLRQMNEKEIEQSYGCSFGL